MVDLMAWDQTNEPPLTELKITQFTQDLKELTHCGMGNLAFIHLVQKVIQLIPFAFNFIKNVHFNYTASVHIMDCCLVRTKGEDRRRHMTPLCYNNQHKPIP